MRRRLQEVSDSINEALTMSQIDMQVRHAVCTRIRLKNPA